jgi:phage shock protein A
MAIIEFSKQITNYLDSEEMVTAPANPVEGQRWTDTSKSPPVAMIYKDGEWKPERLSVEVLDPDFYQDLEDTKTEVAAAIEKAEAAEKAGKDAQAAGEAAQSAASEAKLAGENAANLATQASLDAQTAKAKADAIQIDVNGLVSDVATINGTVTAISSKANEAYEKAAAVEGRTATLETSVTGLTGRMTDIETTSTSTTKKLNELVVTVDGQKQTLATVTTTADSALNKANVLETTVDGVTQTLTSVETTANSALSKVNTVSSTVDGHTQLIATTKTTADSALTKATQVETTANGLKTTISSIETTANTALTKATQVEATANGLTTTVTNIQSDINNLSTATRNLLTKTATLADRLSGSLDANNSYNGNATLKGTFSSNYVDTFRQKTASIPRDGKFTVTFWAKADRNINFNNYFYGTGTTTSVVNSDGKNGTGSDGNNVLAATTSWKRYWITWTQQGASASKEILLGRIFSAGSLWINSPMLIEGTMPTDWAPAPEDMATISQITQLSDQMNFKLTSTDGGVTQIDMQNQIVTISSENIYLTGKSNISDAIIKTAHIADLAVSNGKIANLAVTEGKIGNLAVTTAKIADLAVNNAKIASLDAAKINTGYLAAARIAASSITTDKLNVEKLSALTSKLGEVDAGTITGVVINGSEFINAFTYTESGVTYTGTTTMKDGNVVISRTGSDGSSWTTKVDRQLGFEDSYKAGSTAPARTTRLGQGKLYMVESGVGGYLPASALNSTSWVNLPYASGWTTAENNPCQYRMFPQLDGSYLIRFRGQFAPTSGTIPSGNQQPFGAGGIPVAIRPDKTEFGYGASNQNAGGRLAISGAGNFFYNPETTGQTYCSISGISYYIG